MLSFSLLSSGLLSTCILAAPSTILTARGAPGVPSIAVAEKLLVELTVAPQGPQTGYSRDLFPHWITLPGKCNTRKLVLQRDGSNAVISDTCAVLRGTWLSPYDGAIWDDVSDVDIDHMVPLSNAWKSGAANWTTEQRQAFANDLDNPQLWAVTDDVNNEKSDSGPEQWVPPLASYHCTYARAWIKVKSVYDLTITEEEKEALISMLKTC
ncbi:hypothetical protein QTJ16_006463 [Diplocarpon rosae]|uniref:GmrSD restriction endonucleases C-terminal domain-containing protein n=1 Tax=Diplocarpon rosae TaxID=946125 RepID=A0AAD9WBU5_9HELO|nr:hypothetical protein QTJ16_006463 [Diplocarpon rosae]